MRILNICDSDYAGVGIALTKAVNWHTSHQARHICMVLHPFGYDHDIQTRDHNEVKKWVEWADVVNAHDSFAPLRQNKTPTLRPENLIITYHGTRYRRYHWELHVNAKEMAAKKSLVTTPDLTRYGGAEWLPTAIPVDEYASLRRKGTGKPTVCQTPSRPEWQGTEQVKALLGKRRDIELVITDRVSHAEALRCKAGADIFIDRFILGLGVSGLEALAMGIPVIAHAQPEDERCILREIGYLPYFDSALEKLPDAIERLLSNKALYDEYVKRGQKYIREFHDYPVVARHYAAICERVCPKPVKVSAMPMKIGVVSGGRQIGGAEVLCVLFANWLKSKGLDVWLHVGTGGENQLSDLVAGSTARVIDGLHEAEDSDAVFLYGTKLVGQHKAWAEQINQARQVFAFVGGFNPDYADPHHLRVDGYWCESKSIAHYLARHLRIPAGKIKICRLPVVPNRGVGAKRLYPDRFTFGLAARLYARKQPLTIVEAFETLNRPDSALVVIGGGPLGRAIKKKARTMSLPVHLAGLVTRHKRYLQLLCGLDCLVSASDWEGCSVTMRDAMVLGVPVIGRRGYYVASDNSTWPGGTPELIEHQKTGLLFLSKMDSLVDGMRWMMEHPDERERIVANAKAFMRDSNHASAKRALEILAGK